MWQRPVASWSSGRSFCSRELLLVGFHKSSSLHTWAGATFCFVVTPQSDHASLHTVEESLCSAHRIAHESVTALGRAGFTNKLRALGVGRRVTVLLLELTALGTYLEQYKAESVK